MAKRGNEPVKRTRLTTGQKIQMACITTLWLLLCGLLVATRPLTLLLLFEMAASGIVVFVPLYKKYYRKNGEN
ncbi:MAG: hypothetical protein K2M76_05395 [Muribaculaceae bacterium]|nr:hypothetical protein [Muribaculaceae bacterium]